MATNGLNLFKTSFIVSTKPSYLRWSMIYTLRISPLS
jgi:hypothetical protein